MADMTLDELTEAASVALDGLGIQPANGRMRERPDARTIRYYTTIGIVDPPLHHRGRVAHYGERHLLQVVAIKVLQADGATLAALQRQLVGASAQHRQVDARRMRRLHPWLWRRGPPSHDATRRSGRLRLQPRQHRSPVSPIRSP